MLSRFAVGYEQVCRAILVAFIINVALLVHMLMGLVVLGLFPAIDAAYATWRTWMIDIDHSWSCKQTWLTFHHAWKDGFRSANLAGWPQALLWMLLIYDYSVVNFHDAGTMGYVSAGLLMLIIMLYGVFSMLFWVMRANFAENNRWCIRMTMQMLIVRPLCTLITVLAFIFTVLIWLTWPGVMVAFGVSLPIFMSVGCVFYFGRIPGMDVRDTDAWKSRHQA